MAGAAAFRPEADPDAAVALRADEKRKTQKPARLDAPKRVTAIPRDDGSAFLRWGNTNAKKRVLFVLERSRDGEKWRLVAELGKRRLSYTDDEVFEGRAYLYRVRAQSGERRSPFSAIAKVHMPKRDDPVIEPPAPKPDPRPLPEPDPRPLPEPLPDPIPDGPADDTTHGVLVSPPQSAVDFAIAQPLNRYGRSIAGGAYTNLPGSGDAPLVLAAAAFAGNETADQRLLEQMRYSITAGYEIAANGGYPAQHERHVTAMFSVAKLTPRIWNQLTDEERGKVDLVMKAALVASAFTTSDRNPFILAGAQQFTLDGDSNVGRDWNPNYREGMVGGMLVGMTYFGGPGNVSAMLDGYDHAAFVAELKSAGLTNLVSTFDWKTNHPASSAPTGAMIEDAIDGWRYKGIGIADYMGVYARLATFTFGGVVKAGINDGYGMAGAGKILSGADQLPNLGKAGMLLEFHSSDAMGPRSSAAYAYDGFRTHLSNHFVLLAGGYWDPTSAVAIEALQRMKIGAADLWYKLDQGYANYQKGYFSGVIRITDPGRGFEMVRPFWEEVVRAYHA